MAVFEFDEFVFDEVRCELTRAGVEIRADSQVLELLSYFLRHPGRVIAREELIAAVWQGRVLSDNVYGRGYRFMAWAHHPFENVSPLWPFVQVLTAWGLQFDAATDLAEQVPSGDETRAHEAWQKSVFYATETLRTKCAAQPRVIIIEDVHWADAASHQMLSHRVTIVARLPLLVVVTVRRTQLPENAGKRRAGDRASHCMRSALRFGALRASGRRTGIASALRSGAGVGAGARLRRGPGTRKPADDSERFGLQPQFAQTCYEYAQLLAMGDERERRRARELSGLALETAQRLGMAPLASSSERLLGTLAGGGVASEFHRNP